MQNSEKSLVEPLSFCSVLLGQTLFRTQCGVSAGGDVHWTTLENHVYTYNGGGASNDRNFPTSLEL